MFMVIFECAINWLVLQVMKMFICIILLTLCTSEIVFTNFAGLFTLEVTSKKHVVASAHCPFLGTQLTKAWQASKLLYIFL